MTKAQGSAAQSEGPQLGADRAKRWEDHSLSQENRESKCLTALHGLITRGTSELQSVFQCLQMRGSSFSLRYLGADERAPQAERESARVELQVVLPSPPRTSQCLCSQQHTDARHLQTHPPQVPLSRRIPEVLTLRSPLDDGSAVRTRMIFSEVTGCAEKDSMTRGVAASRNAAGSLRQKAGREEAFPINGVFSMTHAGVEKRSQSVREHVRPLTEVNGCCALKRARRLLSTLEQRRENGKPLRPISGNFDAYRTENGRGSGRLCVGKF